MAGFFKTCNNCNQKKEQLAAEIEKIKQSEEYKYQESMWEHRYP
jgi:hypothetical protein